MHSNHEFLCGFTQSLQADAGHNLNNLLTPWSRVLLEKLIVTQLVKKFPTFYGTQRFITIQEPGNSKA